MDSSVPKVNKRSIRGAKTGKVFLSELLRAAILDRKGGATGFAVAQARGSGLQVDGLWILAIGEEGRARLSKLHPPAGVPNVKFRSDLGPARLGVTEFARAGTCGLERASKCEAHRTLLGQRQHHARAFRTLRAWLRWALHWLVIVGFEPSIGFPSCKVLVSLSKRRLPMQERDEAGDIPNQIFAPCTRRHGEREDGQLPKRSFIRG